MILKGKECSRMAINDKVTIVNDALRYFYEDVILMQCIKGYELETGELLSSCKSDQSWNSTIPLCKGF